jgi:hypothetical protein
MNTVPTVDDLLEGFIIALNNEIMPFLNNPKAVATAAMMQSLLQEIRQVLPVFDRTIAEEHNQMTQTLRDVAALLHGVSGDEADRIRTRASTLGSLTDVPVPVDQEPVRAAHQKLGYALQDTISDLDVLQRAGETKADEALTRLRMFLMPTIINHVTAISVGGGMVGRG